MSEKATRRFAGTMQFLSLTGIVLLVTTFGVYVSGVAPSQTSPARTAELWHLDVGSFNEAVGRPTGWSWIRDFFQGENLAFASLVFIAVCTIIALFFTLPPYLHEGNKRYAAIIITQIVILVVASSGVVVLF